MALWTPAEIGTELWIDFSDESSVTRVDSLVSAVQDKSGNARHGAQSSTGARPFYLHSIVNGRSAARFDGVNDRIDISGAGDIARAVNGLSIVGVGQNFRDADKVFLWIASAGSASRALLRGTDTTNQSGGRRLDADSYASITSPAKASGPHIYGAVFDWGNAHLTSVLDGDSADAAFQTAGTTSNTASSVVVIGGYTGSGTYELDGLVGEIVVCPGAISLEVRQRLEGYLAHKWGLAGNLPLSHPYRHFPPASHRLYGTVADVYGDPAERAIVAIREADHSVVGSAISDETTGEWEIETPWDEPHTLVFGGEPDRNALVFSGVLPE